MKLAIFAPLLCVAACSPFPRDAAGTSERVEATDSMRVGLVSGTRDAEAGRELAVQLAHRYGASVEWSEAPASILLRNLDENKLDLVLGEFGRKGPASKEVSLSEAIGKPEPRDEMLPALRFARKNGENRLITISDKMVMQ